ncbi:hypothetical protein [Fibrobacter sp.]|uniref:hypothetical protein n=1 Tax=Fibrobacter sp. TaxID=35828 RepID=UPI0025C2A643|nr:hypothetical protein [Fibrobacter sp.]MBR3072282.1 hypothetical protein [Fibrobacter sp.]
MKGLTSIRTARLIASLIAILGMFSFAVERVLTKVCIMAKSGVQMGLARYTNSFTGRFAAENFSDDKKLLSVLRNAKELLPVADEALLVLFIVSIVLFVIAAFGLAFPKPFCRVLVAVKLLKWQDGGLLKDASIFGSRESSSKPVKKFKDFCRKALAAAKKVQMKYWIFIGGAFVFIMILIFGVRGCSTGSVFGGSQALTDDLTEQASFYISAQKSYFAKNKAVGGPKALQMPDSLSTDFFTYRVTGSRFVATLNKNIKDCPAGSRWTVSATTKGFFTVDLILSRVAPKDSNCAFIAPDFKNLGRK